MFRFAIVCDLATYTIAANGVDGSSICNSEGALKHALEEKGPAWAIEAKGPRKPAFKGD